MKRVDAGPSLCRVLSLLGGFHYFFVCPFLLSSTSAFPLAVNLSKAKNHQRIFNPKIQIPRRNDYGPNRKRTCRMFQSLKEEIEFLGRGSDAIVRVGSVLLSPAEEFHTLLRQAALFIFSMGTDDHGVFVIRGIIADYPTPFTMQEMIDVDGAIDAKYIDLFQKPVFRGGNFGGESVMLFHSDSELAEQEGLDMIGNSGIYVGGLDSFSEMKSSAEYKFVFNYIEFTEDEINNMLEDPQDDGDAWISLQVPPSYVLNSEYVRGEAWSRLRNIIRQKETPSTPSE